MPGTTLLLVDVQKDFHPGGSLAIPTANEDAHRIAELIRNHSQDIDRIVATMDTHQKLHIAHPCFWYDAQKQRHPDPFTIISYQDLCEGKWKPRSDFTLNNVSEMIDPQVFFDMESVHENGSLDMEKYVIEYARRLEEKGRFQICVWPEHCLIGSEGHAIVDPVRAAMEGWTAQTGRSIEWVLKGQNLLTEMYSALAADVPVTQATSFNESLQTSLRQSDRLIVCGQAMSHCVNYTLRDIVEHWPADERSKITLLTDCASAVPGFEAAANAFQEDMKAVGVKLMKASEAL